MGIYLNPGNRGFWQLVRSKIYVDNFLPLPHTDKPALVVEMKYDKSARAVIRQIIDRKYM